MLVANSGPHVAKMRKATPEKIAEARRLYLGGMSWAAIGPRVGLSAATVRRYCLDISRDPSAAMELAWRMGRCMTEVSADTRAKLSEAGKRKWAKITDRGAINRKRWEYVRLMNA